MQLSSKIVASHTPKDRGWLGLQSMEDVNRALIAKLGWNMIADRNLLWVKVLEAKSCRSESYLIASSIRDVS